jgi:hypothetical protein
MIWDALVGAALGAGTVAVGAFIARGNIGYMVNSPLGRLATIIGAGLGAYLKAGQLLGWN